MQEYTKNRDINIHCVPTNLEFTMSKSFMATNLECYTEISAVWISFLTITSFTEKCKFSSSTDFDHLCVEYLLVILQ